MKRSMIAMSGAAGVALLAAACGSTSGTNYSPTSQVPPATGPNNAPTATPTTIDLANSKLGQILADNEGHSLYLFEADTSATSTCVSAGCVTEWPPLIANGSPQVGAGLAANQLGTTTRADGHQQVTYHGHPLYYFAGDSQPGATAGQGLNDNGGAWYLVHTDGTAVNNG
jgi:predicted lipoprotein with Yx(FWY)xxD motif